MWVVFLILGLVLLFLFLLSILVIYNRQYWRFLDVPHESPQPLIELFKAISKHVGEEEYEVEQEHFKELYWRFKSSGAPFCGYYHFLQPRVLVLDLELVKQILIKDFSNFNGRGVYYNCRDDPLSADLWSRNGERWKEMRIKLEPIFRKEPMRHVYPGMKNECEKLITKISVTLASQDEGVLIYMKRIIKQYVLASMSSCVFGLNTPELQIKYPLEEFEAATTLLLHTRRHDVFLNAILTRYYKLARDCRFGITNRKVSNYFMTLINDVVSLREKQESKINKTEGCDFLQFLLDIKTQELATHETDEEFDAKKLNQHLNDELAAHAISFLKAGFEPTANTLAHILYELALNEWVQDRARDELMEALARHNNELSYDCIQELKFMGQIISETIRMHPVVPFLIRRTLNDYHVPSHPNYLIRKDVYVIIPTHPMHNHPDNYADPHLFQPERFSSEQNKCREQCLWLGFGEGARSCIGIQFSQLQIRLVVARLLQEYRVLLNPIHVYNKYQPGDYLQLKQLGTTPKEENEREL